MKQPGTGHKHAGRAEAVAALREWIRTHGGHQSALARAARVSDEFVSSVLRGKTVPIPDSLLAVIGWHGVVIYQPREAV